MKIALASLLVSQLALAQTPAAAADAPTAVPATTPAPAEAPSAVTAVAGVDSMRVVNRAAFWAVAGVSIATLIFSIVMDGIAAGTRRGASSLTNATDSLTAQNTAVAQTNVANVGYAVGAVFGLATAVVGRFTRWNN